VAQKQSLLFLGVGNEILTDDGIGIKLIQDIRNMTLFPDATFQTSCNGGMDILEMIKNYEEVIIIDAIKTKEGVPGDVYYFTPEDIHETLHISNFHDISFLDALRLGHILKFNMPEKIHIVAIEIVEDMEFNNQFSPVIQSKYDKIKMDVTDTISTIKRAYIS